MEKFILASYMKCNSSFCIIQWLEMEREEHKENLNDHPTTILLSIGFVYLHLRALLSILWFISVPFLWITRQDNYILECQTNLFPFCIRIDNCFEDTFQWMDTFYKHIQIGCSFPLKLLDFVSNICELCLMWVLLHVIWY